MDLKDELRAYLEESGVVTDVIDDFFARYEEGLKSPSDDPNSRSLDPFLTSLQVSASSEKDWKKKTAILAQMISYKYEKGLYEA